MITEITTENLALKKKIGNSWGKMTSIFHGIRRTIETSTSRIPSILGISRAWYYRQLFFTHSRQEVQSI
ncbi:MAG: hypothetical protein QW292_11700 [Candidatus Parvarchaeota archaeon]